MLCEKCQKRPAEVALKEDINGVSHELFVCQECATEPIERKLAAMVKMVLGAMGIEDGGILDDFKEPRCAACGLTRGDLRKRERMGCAACYQSFPRDVEAMVRDMHRGQTHIGKMPHAVQRATARRKLEDALRAAVAAQRFEEAAQLRDQLAVQAVEVLPGGGQ